MPVVGVPTEILRSLVRQDVSDEKLDELLDRLGCDVEGLTTVRRLECPACAAVIERAEKDELLGACPECLTTAGDDPARFWKELGTERVIRMELVPSRPDLFDAGGLSRALRGLLGIETGLPSYEPVDSGLVVHCDPAMANSGSYRPFIGCAAVRGVKLDDRMIRQIMKMQEDLHWALGRNRKFASIGVYDMSALEAPFHYRPVAPDELAFVPLATTDGKALTPAQILSDHPKGKAFDFLLEGQSKFPLLIDNAGQVLSMPPIINSHETRLRAESTDLFVDVTGIEPRPVANALAVVATSLAELSPGATIETVTIIGKDGDQVTPDLSPRPATLDAPGAARLIGVPLGDEDVAKLLRTMRFDATANGDTVTVAVPAFRNDILHEVDLVEDVAIAIGYANIPPVLVPSFTRATERAERSVQRDVRTTLLGLGFAEAMSLMLTNEEELYEKVRREDPADSVAVDNPASSEQTILRTALAPGLLRLLADNKGAGVSRRVFEADDVVRIEPALEEPVEKLHVAAAIQDRSAGFAEIKSIANAIARELGRNFEWAASDDPIFLEGRGAVLSENGETIGNAGEVHPEVLGNFGLNLPVAILEIELI